MQNQSEKLRAKGDAFILKQSFSIWAASERSRLLASVRHTRLTRDCFVRWTNRRENIQHLEGKSISFDDMKHHLTLQSLPTNTTSSPPRKPSTPAFPGGETASVIARTSFSKPTSYTSRKLGPKPFEHGRLPLHVCKPILWLRTMLIGTLPSGQS